MFNTALSIILWIFLLVILVLAIVAATIVYKSDHSIIQKNDVSYGSASVIDYVVYFKHGKTRTDNSVITAYVDAKLAEQTIDSDWSEVAKEIADKIYKTNGIRGVSVQLVFEKTTTGAESAVYTKGTIEPLKNFVNL